ncbi:helix-turn-helix domain-containing protein [Flavobacteriaceae bacterium]|nr:helix-turn-helix domain-containing protein [Flavobacteriaceae bacterium]
MENLFEQKLEGFETYKWISVDDCSEELGVSRRTIFQYLRDGKIKGIKWKNRRLIDSVSVVGYLLEKKVFEVNKLHNKEMIRELELNQYKEL